MMKKMGKGGMLKQAMKGMFGKGGMPDMNDPKAMEEAAKMLGRSGGGLTARVEDLQNKIKKLEQDLKKKASQSVSIDDLLKEALEGLPGWERAEEDRKIREKPDRDHSQQ